MAKTDPVTTNEFMLIYHKLSLISSTWGDLWITLFFLGAENCRVISIRYSDIKGNTLKLPETPRFPSKKITIHETLLQIFKSRKASNPNDVYVFQSKSNRVKGNTKPVTAIAMNMALKKAAKGVTPKNVSMKSAQKVTKR